MNLALLAVTLLLSASEAAPPQTVAVHVKRIFPAEVGDVELPRTEELQIPIDKRGCGAAMELGEMTYTLKVAPHENSIEVSAQLEAAVKKNAEGERAAPRLEIHQRQEGREDVALTFVLEGAFASPGWDGKGSFSELLDMGKAVDPRFWSKLFLVCVADSHLTSPVVPEGVWCGDRGSTQLPFGAGLGFRRQSLHCRRIHSNPKSSGRQRDHHILILISLADGPKHGYAMTEDIARIADLRLGPGTLYGAISRLEARGMIEAVGAEDRRNPYRITAFGEKALRTRLASIQNVARIGQRRLANA